MIGRLNHVAIAVPDAAAASAVYRDTLGAKVSAPMALPEHGVSVVFVELPNTKIELIEPLGEHSPIAKFLGKHPEGAIHHLCFEVGDIVAARDQLKRAGTRVLGDGEPKIGAHGKPVAVPKSQGLRWNPDRTRTGVKRSDLSRVTERVLWQSEPPGFQAGDADLCLPRFFKSFPLVKAQRAQIVLIDFQSDAARGEPARFVQKKSRGAAAFCIWRDGYLIEIGLSRIEIHKAEQPVRPVKSADRDGSRCFKFVQMIEKPWFPGGKINLTASPLASLRPIAPRGFRGQHLSGGAGYACNGGGGLGHVAHAEPSQRVRSPAKGEFFPTLEQRGEYILLLGTKNQRLS